MKKLCFFLLLSLACFNSYAKKPTFSDIEKLKVAFEKKHALPLYIKNIPRSTWNQSTGIQSRWKLEYKPLTEEFYQDLLIFIPILDKEFSKYPQSIINKSGLKGIVLVMLLSVGGQNRAAVPDVDKEYLFYDFFMVTDFEIYQKHVIHHEFYHMIEQQINGNTYWKDLAWMALNDPEFNYGGGGWMQRNSNAYEYSHPQKGFVNLYSMSGVEEDKADTFAELFVQEEYQKVLKWSKSDKILQNKMNYMKTFLEKIDSSFNKQYWDSLHK